MNTFRVTNCKWIANTHPLRPKNKGNVGWTATGVNTWCVYKEQC